MAFSDKIKDVLLKDITYDPDTGDLFRKGVKIVNKPDSTTGYIKLSIAGKQVYSHRVAWFLFFGEEPKVGIDHVNQIKTDNRISNLRLASKSENGRNTKLPRDNTSGVIGVSWSKISQKWRAYISVEGKQHHLGLFDSKEDAISARKDANILFNFSENHGG